MSECTCASCTHERATGWKPGTAGTQRVLTRSESMRIQDRENTRRRHQPKHLRPGRTR